MPVSDQLTVDVVYMVKQEFLVATHIRWTSVAPLEPLNRCYVTWEVLGGGLVGHMLTDTHTADLSLWPHTKYSVGVVCKSMVSGRRRMFALA